MDLLLPPGAMMIMSDFAYFHGTHATGVCIVPMSLRERLPPVMTVPLPCKDVRPPCIVILVHSFAEILLFVHPGLSV